MQTSWIVIFSLSLFAAIHANPARHGLDEIDFVPLDDQNGGPIVDTGSMEGPWFSPFDGLFESLAGMMARMRQQMDYLLKRLPVGNGTADGSPFPVFPDIAGLDLGKGNTTSVTKVIDGHKVVINETEYKQEGDFGGAFFKVRIIDVQPDSSEVTTEQDAEEVATTKDVESVENSFENEIPKNKEHEVFSNIETFDEPDSSEPIPKLTDRSAFLDSVEPLDSFEDNSIQSFYPPKDLSRDIYVNRVMAEAGAATDPDAEIFSSVEANVPYATGRRLPFEKFMNPR